MLHLLRKSRSPLFISSVASLCSYNAVQYYTRQRNTVQIIPTDYEVILRIFIDLTEHIRLYKPH